MNGSEYCAEAESRVIGSEHCEWAARRRRKDREEEERVGRRGGRRKGEECCCCLSAGLDDDQLDVNDPHDELKSFWFGLLV